MIFVCRLLIASLLLFDVVFADVSPGNFESLNRVYWLYDSGDSRRTRLPQSFDKITNYNFTWFFHDQFGVQDPSKYGASFGKSPKLYPPNSYYGLAGVIVRLDGRGGLDVPTSTSVGNFSTLRPEAWLKYPGFEQLNSLSVFDWNLDIELYSNVEDLRNYAESIVDLSYPLTLRLYARCLDADKKEVFLDRWLKSKSFTMQGLGGWYQTVSEPKIQVSKKDYMLKKSECRDRTSGSYQLDSYLVVDYYPFSNAPSFDDEYPVRIGGGSLLVEFAGIKVREFVETFSSQTIPNLASESSDSQKYEISEDLCKKIGSDLTQCKSLPNPETKVEFKTDFHSSEDRIASLNDISKDLNVWYSVRCQSTKPLDLSFRFSSGEGVSISPLIVNSPNQMIKLEDVSEEQVPIELLYNSKSNNFINPGCSIIVDDTIRYSNVSQLSGKYKSFSQRSKFLEEIILRIIPASSTESSAITKIGAYATDKKSELIRNCLNLIGETSSGDDVTDADKCLNSSNSEAITMAFETFAVDEIQNDLADLQQNGISTLYKFFENENQKLLAEISSLKAYIEGQIRMLRDKPYAKNLLNRFKRIDRS